MIGVLTCSIMIAAVFYVVSIDVYRSGMKPEVMIRDIGYALFVLPVSFLPVGIHGMSAKNIGLSFMYAGWIFFVLIGITVYLLSKRKS